MSFSTSTEKFMNVFMTTNPDEELTKEFFDGVLQYLDKRRQLTKEAGRLYDWIKEGNPMTGFLCGTDVRHDIADEMVETELPFLCITEPHGESGFLIRACDDKKADDIKDKVLDNRSRYCKIVTSEELKTDVIKAKEADKNVIHINHLSSEQAEILRDLCEENLDETEVGIDEMEDGTYMFTFYGKLGIPKRRGSSMGISELFVLLMLMSKGFQSDINQRIARNKRNFDLALARGFQIANKVAGREEKINLRNTPAWVVGRGPHYICLNGSGFEFGIAIAEGSDVRLEEIYSVDANSPEYDAELVSYMARINDKTFTYNQKQALKHLSGKEAGLTYTRSSDNKIVNSVNHKMANKINEIVMAKLEADPVMIMNGHWDKKFDLYMQEAATLIDGARILLNEVARQVVLTGKSEEEVYEELITKGNVERVPEGYTLDDFKELIEIPQTHGLKLEAYVPAISAMRHIEKTMVKAQVPQIKDINQQLKNVGGDRDKTQGREQEYRRDRFETSPTGRSEKSREGGVTIGR